MTCDRLIDNVLEKLTAAMTSLKSGTFNYILQVSLNCGDIFFCHNNFHQFDHPCFILKGKGLGKLWREEHSHFGRGGSLVQIYSKLVAARFDPAHLPQTYLR